MDESTVKETNQKRENDEYDTDEDTQQTTTNYYQPAFSSKGYLAASEPAQYLDQYLPNTLTQSKTDPTSFNNNNNNDNNDNNNNNNYDEYDTENSETKRLRLRKEKDEALKRSAMELDRRFSVPKQGLIDHTKNINKLTKSSSAYKLFDDNYDSDSQNDEMIKKSKRTQSSGGIHDIIEQQRERENNRNRIIDNVINEEEKYHENNHNDDDDDDDNNNFLNDSNDGNSELFESPIPKQAKHRYSRYMTQQYARKIRVQSEDLSFSNQNDFISPSFTNNRNHQSPQSSNHSNHSNHSNQSNDSVTMNINTAIIAHNELSKEGGSLIRSTIKSSDWHSGIEISWRTTPLPPRDNNKLLLEQNFHCATCGLVLKSNFLRRARYHYCRYLGLIHCNECHKNERAVIPHRVLHDLDCKPATVCCAAKQYLDQMYNIPCIQLSQFSQDNKIQNNKKIIQLKKILFELTNIMKYINVCRDKNDLLDNIYNEYKPWLKHTDCLSLRDCVNIISFNTGDKLQILSNKLQKHIKIECDMCRLKGSYCEICKNQQQIIYSFQYKQVEQCKICKACFHSQCWINSGKNCPRCQRRQKIMPQIK